MTNVDVCVATYRRPQLLKRLLESLVAQDTRGAFKFRIIVVDNDAQGSAESLVNAFRDAGPEIVFDVEPNQNISLARNRALSHTTAEFIATTDDDAAAEPDWLYQMLDARRRYDADAVFGAVLRVLPDDAPRYLRESGAFDLPNPPTGTSEYLVCNTANSLFRHSLIDGIDEPFDPSLGKIGGEDTQFFQNLKARGASFVWCREAVVRERVLDSRARLGWVLRRRFREGIGYCRLRRTWMIAPDAALPERFLRLGLWSAKTGVRALMRSVGAVFAPSLRPKLLQDLRALAFHWGMAACTLGFRYEQYGGGENAWRLMRAPAARPASTAARRRPPR